MTHKGVRLKTAHRLPGWLHHGLTKVTGDPEGLVGALFAGLGSTVTVFVDGFMGREIGMERGPTRAHLASVSPASDGG